MNDERSGVADPTADSVPGGAPVSPPSIPLAAAPAGSGERWEALDVARGFALLGILVLNITSFAFPSSAYLDPALAGTATALDRAAFDINYIVFNQKMMTLFSILFGAGIVLFSERSAARTGSAAGLHYRRMLLLMLFGALHAYGLWYGDILFAYAVIGMVVFPLWRVPGAVLLVMGPAVLLLSLGWLSLVGAAWVHSDGGMETASSKAAAEAVALTAREVAAVEGGLLSRLRMNAELSMTMQVFYLPLFFGPMLLGIMMTGMGLYRIGFITGRFGWRTYVFAASVLLPVGALLSWFGLSLMRGHAFAIPAMTKYAGHPNTIAAVLMAVGCIAVINAAVKTGAGRLVRGALSSVGRLAFTNYIMQTVIGCLIFYTPGLGLYMEFGRAELWLFVLGVWALQITLSVLYLRVYAMGPLEWFWRCGTYLRWIPMPRAKPRLPKEVL